MERRRMEVGTLTCQGIGDFLMSTTRLLLCLFLIAYLAGCRDAKHESASAPPITPSEDGSCQSYRSQLQQKVAVANQGDAAEMYALGIYYAVCDGKDSEGELWIERAANAG